MASLVCAHSRALEPRQLRKQSSSTPSVGQSSATERRCKPRESTVVVLNGDSNRQKPDRPELLARRRALSGGLLAALALAVPGSSTQAVETEVLSVSEDLDVDAVDATTAFSCAAAALVGAGAAYVPLDRDIKQQKAELEAEQAVSDDLEQQLADMEDALAAKTGVSEDAIRTLENQLQQLKDSSAAAAATAAGELAEEQKRRTELESKLLQEIGAQYEDLLKNQRELTTSCQAAIQKLEEDLQEDARVAATRIASLIQQTDALVAEKQKAITLSTEQAAALEGMERELAEMEGELEKVRAKEREAAAALGEAVEQGATADARVAGLEERLAAAAEQAGALEGVVAEKEEELDLAAELQRTTAAVTAKLEERLAAKAEKAAALEASVAAKAEEAAELRERMDATVAKLEARLAAAAEQVAALEAAVVEKAEACEGLVRELVEDHEREAYGLQKQLDAARGQLGQAKVQLEVAAAQAGSAGEELEAAKVQAGSAAEELKAARGQLAAAEAQLERREQSLGEAEARAAAGAGAAEELRLKLEVATTAAEAETTMLKLELKEARDGAAAQQEELAAAQQQLQAAQAEAAEASTRPTAEEQALQQEARQLKARLKTVEGYAESAIVETDQLKKRLAGINAEKVAAQQELKKVQASSGPAAEHFQQQAEQLREQLIAAEDDAEAATLEREQLQSRIAEIEAEKVAAQQELKKLKVSSRPAEHEQALRQQAEELKAQLIAAEDDAEAATLERDQLSSRIEEINAEKVAAQEELQEVRGQVQEVQAQVLQLLEDQHALEQAQRSKEAEAQPQPQPPAQGPPEDTEHLKRLLRAAEAELQEMSATLDEERAEAEQRIQELESAVMVGGSIVEDYEGEIETMRREMLQLKKAAAGGARGAKPEAKPAGAEPPRADPVRVSQAELVNQAEVLARIKRKNEKRVI